MKTCTSLGFFCKGNVIFTTRMPFFVLSPLENEFLPKFWNINAHNNQEITIKYWETFLFEVCGRIFWSFFASISLGPMVIWTQNVLSDDTPEIY